MNKEFLDEMKLEYDRRVKTIESITTKSIALMTISGITAALVMGPYGSLEVFDQSLANTYRIIGFIAVLSPIALGIFMNVVDFRRAVFQGTSMIKNDKPNFEKLDDWINLEEKEYYHKLIGKYVQCLNHAEQAINKKLCWFVGGSTVFLCGLILLLIPIIATNRGF